MTVRGYFFLIGLLASFYCLFVPVPVVEVRDEKGTLALSFRVFLGESFRTEYIHSVQLCPVVDEFVALGGRLWLREEATQSTNAGLPSEAPHLGRFVYTPPWYRYIGGRHSYLAIRLRVGDEAIGRNRLFLPSGEQVDLFTLFSGKLLTLRAR